MTKSNEKEESPQTRPLAAKFLRGILFLIPIFLFSTLLAHVHSPFTAFRVYQNPSKNVQKAEHFSLPIFKETREDTDPKTEEFIRNSLRLFKDILTHVSEGLDSNHSNSSLRRLEARGLVTEFESLFLGKGAGGGFLSSLASGAADASMYLGIGIGNGTVSALDLPKMFTKVSKAASQKATGINLIAENLGQGLSSSLVGSIDTSNFKPNIDALGPTSRAIGEGVGSGAAVGLNLKTLDSKGFNNTGIAGIAGNLTQGLTSSFIGGVDLKATLKSVMGNMTSAQANEAALSLAQGLGSGAAFASKLSPSIPDDAFDKEGINGAAGSLGQGLTTSFIQGIDIKKIMAMAQGNITPEQTNQAALALAQGIGSGAAFATKLSTTPPAAFDKNGISGVAGSVGQGLSTSFLQDINFKAIASSMAPNISPEQILEASAGLGSGLAEGAVIGIGLQTMDSNSNMNNQGVGPVVENFARGLSQSFLSNGTAIKILNLVSQGQQAPKIDFGAVAKGFAVGLIGGAEMSFENAGGVATIFKMNSEDAAQMMTLPVVMTKINDSVGGAATGFGSGLGLETTKFVLQILGKPPLNSNSAVIPSSEPPTSNVLSPGDQAAVTPDSNAKTSAKLVKSAMVSHFNNHQTVNSIPSVPANSPFFSSSKMLDPSRINETINPLLKYGVDKLGCQGIGGLVSVLLSLGPDASQINPNQIADLQKQFTSKISFADQIFTIQDSKSGNRVDINIAKLELSLNGNSLKKEIIVLVLHIFLGIFTFAIAIPIVLIINSIRNFAFMSGHTDVLKNAIKIKWILSLVFILPSSLAILTFGLLADGTKTHFYSSHGILGTILILLTLLAFPLAYLRPKFDSSRLPFSINLTFILSLTVIVLVTGFVDLSAISFCVTQFVPQFIFVLFGITLIAPLLQSVVMISLELLLKRWKVDTLHNVRNSALTFDSEKASLTRETNPMVGIGGNKDNFMEI